MDIHDEMYDDAIKLIQLNIYLIKMLFSTVSCTWTENPYLGVLNLLFTQYV